MNKELTMNSIKKITNEYYSSFCGVDILSLETGVHFICNPLCDEILKGFGCKYSIYILMKEDCCIVSYSPKYQKDMEDIKKYNTNEMIRILNKKFNLKEMQLFEFEKESIFEYGHAKILKVDDYSFYETFFCETNKGASLEGWLEEYFTLKASKEYFVGYFIDNKLVSVCDAPDMPYLEDMIQHTGICTLKEYRNSGYAKKTAALATHNLIQKGICPQWECDTDNRASIQLAKSIGYKEYGIAYILEE